MPDAMESVAEGADGDADPPLLIASMSCSYQELLVCVQDLAFDQEASSESHRKLPLELAVRVVTFLTVSRVDSSRVKVIQCSSHDKSHALEKCLVDDAGASWWMSATGSMPYGDGKEWLDFDLAPVEKDKGDVSLSLNRSMCRLTSIAISIPPLPQGPLSLREFQLVAVPHDEESDLVKPTEPSDALSTTKVDDVAVDDVAVDDVSDDGNEISRSNAAQEDVIVNGVLKNLTGFQHFLLQGRRDVPRKVRLLCLSNQMSGNLLHGIATFDRWTSVGFYTVRFE